VERQIRILATGFLILFGLLGLNVNYIQVIAARDLANNPANKRLLIQEYDVQRGQILGADGQTVIGTSEETAGALKYLRLYPEESLYAHLSGYYSFVFGRSGLEQSYNDELSGRAPEVALQTFVDEVLGRDRRAGQDPDAEDEGRHDHAIAADRCQAPGAPGQRQNGQAGQSRQPVEDRGGQGRR